MQLGPEDAARLAGDLLDLNTRGGPDSESGSTGLPLSGVHSLPGGRLGNYRITRLVGTGGMGEVYEAEQENPRRRVALKVVRASLMNDGLRRRFEHEVRILGSLQHPGIAQIYEAGQFSGDTGGVASAPFFAMEYVEGEPLTKYATERKLGVKERLELFLRVCQAVEHAHQRGIIHRDLKPANILVAAPATNDTKSGSGLIDQLGQPKVLDFGVARATDADMTVTSVHTEIGKLVGTIPYMSPEQASGDSSDLDTRSDVYALGVVLYELLSGKLPYEMKGDGGARAAEALRAIKEVDPAPLSSVDRVFRGDLETIVGKALEKERGRRYQSVGELAGDIRRHLDDEPIVARRASGWYELKKFTRRNRGMVVAVAIIGVLLVVGTTTASILGLREASARRAAIVDRTTQEKVTRFLQELLLSPSPDQAGRDVRVVDLLRTAAKRLDDGESPNAEVERLLRRSIGRAFHQLHELEQARPEMERAYALSRSLYGEQDARTLEDEYDLFMLNSTWMNSEEALAGMRDIVKRNREVLGESDPGTLAARSTLASMLGARGRLQEAIDEAHGAYLVSRGAWGDDNILTLKIGGSYAHLLGEQGRFAEAVEILQECVSRIDKLKGPTNNSGMKARNTLAALYSRMGRPKDALQVYEGGMDAMLRVYGPGHPGTLTWRMNMARAIGARDGDAVAEKLLKELQNDSIQHLGEGHDLTLSVRYNLAGIAQGAGRFQEAHELLRINVETAEKSLPADSLELAWYRRDYGATLMKQERWQEAEGYLLQALGVLRANVGPRHPGAIKTVDYLAIVHEKLGNDEKAAEYKSIAETLKKPEEATGEKGRTE